MRDDLLDGLKSDNIVHRIQEYANVGVDQFFLAFQDPNDTKS